jgi:hypothetical protein
MAWARSCPQNFDCESWRKGSTGLATFDSLRLQHRPSSTKTMDYAAHNITKMRLIVSSCLRLFHVTDACHENGGYDFDENTLVIEHYTALCDRPDPHPKPIDKKLGTAKPHTQVLLFHPNVKAECCTIQKPLPHCAWGLATLPKKRPEAIEGIILPSRLS